MCKDLQGNFPNIKQVARSLPVNDPKIKAALNSFTLEDLRSVASPDVYSKLVGWSKFNPTALGEWLLANAENLRRRVDFRKGKEAEARKHSRRRHCPA